MAGDGNGPPASVHAGRGTDLDALHTGPRSLSSLLLVQPLSGRAVGRICHGVKYCCLWEEELCLCCDVWLRQCARIVCVTASAGLSDEPKQALLRSA